MTLMLGRVDALTHNMIVYDGQLRIQPGRKETLSTDKYVTWIEVEQKSIWFNVYVYIAQTL